MKKKIYFFVMIVLVLITIAEGFVIYKQYAIIEGRIEVYANDERENIRWLREQLELERKGLRHDTRGGDFCSACDGKSVAIIRYGYWISGMWEDEIKNKEVVIGGCIVNENSKRFCCNDCGYKWGSLNSQNMGEHNGSALYYAEKTNKD